MSLSDQNIFYSVRMSYDGVIRSFYCETTYDTAVLVDALYKGARWDKISVVCLRTNRVIQHIEI